MKVPKLEDYGIQKKDLSDIEKRDEKTLPILFICCAIVSAGYGIFVGLKEGPPLPLIQLLLSILFTTFTYAFAGAFTPFLPTLCNIV